MQATDLRGASLSIQQNRLWPFLQQNVVYRVQGAIWLEGTLDEALFQRALQRLVEQHEILQTAFHTLAGMDVPVQVIGRRSPLDCPIINLEQFDPVAQQKMLDASYHSLQTEPFDLAHGPVFRSTLFRLSGQKHLFFVSLPALCADASTLPLFVAELVRSYEAEVSDEPLEDEPLQYSDVSAWQDELLELETADLPREFWRKIDLAQATQVRLPFTAGISANHPDLAQQDSFEPRSIPIVIDEAQVIAMSRLTDSYHVSVTALLLACWQISLWRVLDEASFVIGVACDGRDQEDLATALGPYTRFVPLGLSFGEQWTFVQVMETVSQSLQAAVRWQLYFTWNDQGRQAGPNYFPFSFEHQTWSATIKGASIVASLSRSSSCIEPFIIKLHVLQVGERLQLELQYDPCRFSAERTDRLSKVLRTLLQAAVAHPQAQISELPLLTQQEAKQLINLFQAPRQALPVSGFHQLFEEQVRKFPLQTALLSVEEAFTYQELNCRANQLARVLQRYGAGPRVAIGLCLSRSARMIVAVLAIFKAGAAYVPLDPESPPARLAYQLQDVQPSLLITEQELSSHLPLFGGQLLYMQTLWAEASQEETSNLSISYSQENLAYVIYTSGSTGMPKGVMIQQRSIINYTCALCELLEPEPGWHFATVSTLSADLGNTAIFCALAAGGCLQILDYATVTSTEAFARWATRHPIDVLKIVPSHLSALLIGDHVSAVLPRKALLLGGEALPAALLERIRGQGASCVIYNHYGPTETTIGVLVNRLSSAEQSKNSPEEMNHPATIPLGKPIANTDVYVLDPSLRIVPVGVTGELYIGGSGLAEGYLHQPEQTAERFLPHPFSAQPGSRLYRTGDLVRATEQGQIEFIGRRDGQVKLRGYRIELGEIEAVLRQHPNVWDSAVVLREEKEGSSHLVGYIVARKQPVPTEIELRDFLRIHLPEYMIPSLFMALKVLPLTANGKVDQRQLPQPEVNLQATRDVLTPPRNPIEEMLLTIWQNLLTMQEIDIHDNFFQLGGHSLLATQVISHVRAVLQVELSIQSLFEHPTIAELAQQVERQVRGMQAELAPVLLPANRTAVLPLSFAQQRLWFLDQLEPGSTAYLIPRARRIRGVLKLAVVERSLAEIVRRHEDLRTTFQEQDGQPVQIIHPAGQFHLPVVDLRGLALEEREREAHNLAKQEAQHPCDLAQGPLLRTALLILKEQDYVLLLTMHHIISDGWSNTVFERELTALYLAFSAGQPSPLPPLPVQYADFALWQRQWLQGEILDAQLAYWKQQLADVPPLELPTDYPRPAIQAFQGAFIWLHLSADLQGELKRISRQEGVTLFMLLLSAFQVLLMRYTGQNDISVGTPVANRTRAELEGLIGFFVNTLVLRTDLSNNPTFTEVLRRVRKVALEAYAHQDVPFEQLIEVLQPERDLSRSPLFQVMFALQMQGEGVETLQELQLSQLNTEHTVSRFDLTMNVTSDKYGLHCGIEYNIGLFEEQTIQRLLSHWQILLEGIVATPHATLANLPLLSEVERQTLLLDWNTTAVPVPNQDCFHVLFDRQVACTPDAIALVYEEQCWSYQYLQQRANQLAHFLRQLGVGPEVLVAVLAERCLEQPLAMLAILKAGGGYMPLDPAYPSERLKWMLEDANPSVLLTAHAATQVPSTSGPRLVCLQTLWPQLEGYSWQIPASEVQLEHTAYIIYTSGSTGTPKGVQVTHRGISNLLHIQQRAFGIGPTSRVLQFASLSFDASIWEAVMALLTGASLHIAKQDRLFPGPDLINLLAEHAISVITLPPSALSVLPLTPLPALTTLVVAGEACPIDVVENWASQRHFFNAYGPTETTVCASMAECVINGQKPAIGTPIANTQLYVLDPCLQPVPRGVPGELYIGGVALARGYLKRPDLTAERFLPDPFSHRNGERLYKTGDRVRYRADGSLEFVGRLDQQIKLRGYRIEIGEIEAVLAHHPAIREAVVLLQGKASLAAYVVPLAADVPPSGGDLRRYLQEKLPNYMIPASMVLLGEMPLTPNGKIDRRALVALGNDTDEREFGGENGELMAPRSPMEELLSGIWSNVLGHSRLSVHDSFFELGGHSLLAVQLVSRIRAALDIALPLRSLFEFPTIAGLAACIETLLRSEESAKIPPLVAVSHDQTLPLSFAQQRLWFLDQLEPESNAYLMSSARRLQGKLDTRALECSLQELVQRHETLRTTFSLHDGQPVQIIHSMASLRLPIVDLRDLLQEERESAVLRLAQQEAQCPCDLAQGALLRAYLLRLAPQEHAFLFTMHHIISDAWSMQIFEREIITCYQAFTADQSLSLPPLPIQYVDYALWQRQWLQGEILNTQLTYWKQQLAEVPPLDLPTDYLRPPIQTYRGAFETLHLPVTLQDELIRLSRQEGCTLFMTLLAAFQVLLTRYTGQNDISVGTPIANRPHSELEGLIGFFLNTLVMRTDLGGNPSFTEALKRVRKVALEAYSHQDIPFEYLVEALQPERDLSRTPLFQVMFILQQDQDREVVQELSELQVRGMQTGHTISKFDLTLNVMSDRGGLHCGIEYNTDLFEAETIRRLLAYWQNLLEGIVAAPQTSLIDLPLLSEKEYHQLLIDWNVTSMAIPTEAGIHELFARQAKSIPDSIALVWEDTYLSYATLDRYADDLAAYLRHLGVKREDLIGLCVERSSEMLIGLLGILKADCAYVPLDPSYPLERLAFIEADARLAIVLTQERLLAAMPHWGQRIICLDRDWETLFAGHVIECVEMIDTQQRAYVIYTSGSTGVPKGVTVSHRNVVNFFTGMDQHIGSEPGGTWLSVTSLSFDISVLELLWTLTRGFRVIIQPALTAESEDYALATQIVRHGVTHLQCTPSLARVLLLMPETAYALKQLQKLLLGGEALPLSLVKQLEAATTAALHNMYGPTETTIWSTTQRLEQIRHVVPLGYPIANTRIYLCDASLHLVPIGSTGEIYIGGAGVARGYHQHPELTAERFIPDPYGGEAGARLYKTGDQARYYADGTLEYLGRADQQVKIRGHRIELAEIESTLEQHPSLHEAVLNVHENTSGDKQLVAYLVLQGATLPSVEELRSYLKQRLPETMLPSHFVFLDALPLTPNGKVDRRALPAPTTPPLERSELVVAPRSPIEGVVAEIWGTILERENVSVHDNFFEQGGHSLLATQLVSRVRSMLNVDLPLRSLFESPTLAGLARHVEVLLRHEESVEVPPLVPMSRQQELPLSFVQQRFWFIHQLEPDSAAYTLPRALRLSGKLNISALLHSFEEIIRRHEILRTRFETHADKPVQVIDELAVFPWQVIDLCNLSLQLREQRAFALLQSEWERPFNLALGPLLRLTLMQLGQEEHILLLTVHHIVADGWALEKFIGELTQLYIAFAANRPSPLPPLPIQYADYALWQRRWLQGRVLDQQIAYWRQQLHDVPVLDLPTDHLRPPMQTFRGAAQSCTLSADLYELLIALGRRENVTLFMLVLAAFQVLLMRYTGQDDIAVGTLIANRTHTELEELIGCFTNTLVLRTRLSGNPTFNELLLRVREVALGAYAHQDIPFEQLVDILQPERDLSRNPLFQVLLLMPNVPRSRETLEEMSMNTVAIQQTTTLFDLILSITPDGEALRCRLEYRTDLFEAETIARLLNHWQTLLAAIVAHPEYRLIDLPLLSDQERQKLLLTWNATETSSPAYHTFHEHFRQQAQQTPDAVALADAGIQLTYQKVDFLSTLLAHHLRKLGVGPESLVGLYLERDVNLILCILATFKAGGAYVPLDPAYPAARLLTILQNASPQVIVTNVVQQPALLSSDTALVQLTSEWFTHHEENLEAPLADLVSENQLAYVIYTSGSTGLPKGVMISHQGMLNHLYAKIEALCLSSTDCVAQTASHCFDISVWQAVAALLVGGRVEIIGDEVAHDPIRLHAHAITTAVSILEVVPSLLQAMLDEEEDRALTYSDFALRWLIVTGEAFPSALGQRWLRRYPQISLMNAYGPTECSDDVTHQVVAALSPMARPSIPIGLPLANTQLYILDSNLAPVPIGVPGQLYVGGTGVGRGYFHDAWNTAVAFIPNPFAQQRGMRLYCTGDRARYLADGSIEFLGRLDEQIKLRGYRIELGEIESVLNRYPGVRESVAVVHGEASDNQRIMAYIVRQQQAILSLEALRTHLRDHLPIYMIPAQVLELEALPLTPNGKIDRQALPKPDEISIQRVEQAPATLTEELVAGLWTQILGVSQINHHDTFFEQGGHSLLATQLVSRIRTMFNVELSLRSFFESPTVAGIAACVDALLRSGQGIELSPILPVSRQQELPLSFAQQRLWFLDRLEPGNIAYLMPNVHRFQERLNVQVLERSLEEVIRRHESLRTTLQVREGRPIQVIHPATSFHLPVVDLAHLEKERRESEAKRLIEQEAQQSMDLTRGPLLRICLLRLDHDDQVLLWTMHHIVSDGWSMQIFEREVVALYQAFASDQPSPLPPLPMHYADFAFWQRQWLQGKVLEAQLDYWITQLSGVPALELPIDYPRPSVQNQQGAVHSFRLSRELSQSLIALSHQQGATLFMTLLAAFQILLYRYSGQRDILVGTDSANRTRTEIEGMIGFFVNLLPLRTSLHGSQSFKEVLRTVREVVLGAYIHQETPFELLVEKLAPTRNLDRVPLVQALLVLQNFSPLQSTQQVATTSAPEQEIIFDPLKAEVATVKFDLALFMREQAGQLSGRLNYRPDLFEMSTITTMTARFETMLQSIVLDPDALIDSLDFLTEEERLQNKREENALKRQLRVRRGERFDLPG